MRPAFKYIVTGIIALLVLIFAFQLFWLKGLYHSIEDETTRDIISCIGTADQEEMQHRMDSIDKAPKRGGEISIGVSASRDEAEHTFVTIKKDKETTQHPDTIKSKRLSDTISGYNAPTLLDQLVLEMKFKLHEALDWMAPVNLNILDSLVRVNFENKAIKAKVYYTEIVDLNTDSVVETSLSDSSFVLPAQSFIYKYNQEKNLAYKIYTESLTKTILTQMSGILFTTLLIITILGFAFWYLIRTVFRQKTLEEMKDDFTNNMTHELKTPIAVAYSATDALLNFNKADDKETREKYLSICKEQLLNLTDLVEQILSMSTNRNKILKLKMEDIPAKPLILSLVEQHALKSDKNISFDLQVPDDLIIRADRNHIHNMISNLIDNAIKYSAENPEIGIRIYQKEGNTFVEVQDKGIGISAENQKHIFDKFYRVPQGNLYNVKGYGLGLHYVKTMAEKHGGTVTVKSSIGNGSIFTLIYPQPPEGGFA
jgi:signal transduction histidine kinase